MIGKVKRFNNVKGYAFIGRYDDPDVFVHYSAILGHGYRTLMEGDSVEFEILQGPKGLARNRGVGIALTDRLSIGLVRVVSNTQNIVGTAHFLRGASESSHARWRANGFEFDIFRVEADAFTWQASSSSFEVDKARIELLDTVRPGEYLVLNRWAGDKTAIRVGSAKAKFGVTS
jgi:cold shock protein